MRTSAILLLWLMLQSGAAFAQEAAAGEASATPAAPAEEGDVSTVHRHDGFMLRFTLGPSFTYANPDENAYNVSGGGGTSSISLGWAVSDGLVLHLETVSTVVPNPSIEWLGMEMGEVDGRLNLATVGPGLSYYWESNIFITGALGMALLDQGASEDIESTDAGWGTRLMVGREWWVSDNWALGLAGDLQYLGVSANDTTWTVLTTGLMFSATYQ